MFDFLRNLTPKKNNLQFEQQQQNLYYPTAAPQAVQYSPDKDPRILGLDQDEDLEKIHATWRGMRLSDDGEKWVPVENAILMINETGANTLLGLHRQMVSISHATTSLSIEDINTICLKYGNNLTEQICAKHEDWEVEKCFFDAIIDPLVESLFMFLKKSENDKQRMWDNNGNKFSGNPQPIGAVPSQLNP